MFLTTKLITTCVLLLILKNSLIAQKLDPAGGSLGISYTLQPLQPFKDTVGGFASHGWSVHLSLPLFGNREKVLPAIKDGERPHFYQVSGHANFESLRAGIGFIAGDRTIYQASAGLGWLSYNGKKDILLADLNIGISSDAPAIQNHDERYRFSGLFLVNHIQNNSLTWQYGLVFTYAYGRPLPLPVLGMRKKISRTWTVAAVLPVSLRFTDRLNKNMRIDFLLRPSGNRFQLQNQHNFGTSSSTVYMQLKQFQLGASWLYRFAPQFSIETEAGLLTGGKLRFTEPDDNKSVLYQTTMKPGFRGRISLRYHLFHKRSAGEMPDNGADLLRVN